MLLRLSSFLKFSQNLKRHEDDSSSTPPFDIYLPYIHKALRYCQNWCGLLLFIHAKAMREAREKDKADIVPTPYFLSAFFGELGSISDKRYDIYYRLSHFNCHLEGS